MLVSQHTLNGRGDGGEGLVIQQWPDGRRVLYLAHEGQQNCLSIIDVTTPEAPVVINQIASPAPGVTRCNSLGLSGTTLALANQTLTKGQKPAGMWLSTCRTSNGCAPPGRCRILRFVLRHIGGVFPRRHCLWFVDGGSSPTTGMPDFEPVNPLTIRCVIVDARIPGRWRPADGGILNEVARRVPAGRLPRATRRSIPPPDHQTQVYPERPDRASHASTAARSRWIFPAGGVKAGRTRVHADGQGATLRRRTGLDLATKSRSSAATSHRVRRSTKTTAPTRKLGGVVDIRVGRIR